MQDARSSFVEAKDGLKDTYDGAKGAVQETAGEVRGMAGEVKAEAARGYSAPRRLLPGRDGGGLLRARHPHRRHRLRGCPNRCLSLRRLRRRWLPTAR